MTLIYFIVILGLTVFIHELGHFIFAKRNGVYCYEFSLGMGPKIYSFRRKNDETLYSLRLLPIGGYVQMAGEEIDTDKNIPSSKRMQSKTGWQRFKIIVAGAMNNFILGIFILFLMSLIYGSYETKPYIGEVDKAYNAYKLNVREGDLITKINDKNVKTIDDVLLQFELIDDGSTVKFTLKTNNNEIKEIKVKPTEDKESNTYIYGFSLASTKNHGFANAIRYTVTEFKSIYKSMYIVITNLLTGGLGIDSLSGPVGIYKAIGSQAKLGFENVMFLGAFISINVGFVNLLPFPALDGGRVLFLIIEKLRKKQVDPKIENTINMIGFGLLMLLILIITIKDVIKLF